MEIFYLILSVLGTLIGVITLIISKNSTNMIVLGMGLLLSSAINSSHSTIYRIVDRLKTNRIVKSNYDNQTNSFNVIYVKNNEERALDGITPIELDSLINSLNK